MTPKIRTTPPVIYHFNSTHAIIIINDKIRNNDIHEGFLNRQYYLEHDEYKEDSDNDDIDDELHSAKLYLQKYLDTKDELYKEMSKDELKHAEILIKKHQSKLLSANKKAKLKEQENLHASIQTQLKNLS